MPCFLGCLGLLFPRLAIILIWLFSDYLGQAYQTILWPVLGFFFMPLTTLAYAWAMHAGGGNVAGGGLVVIVIAVLIDLGILGGGASHRSVRKYVVVRSNRV
jgi:hypothetical protein